MGHNPVLVFSMPQVPLVYVALLLFVSMPQNIHQPISFYDRLQQSVMMLEDHLRWFLLFWSGHCQWLCMKKLIQFGCQSIDKQMYICVQAKEKSHRMYKSIGGAEKSRECEVHFSEKNTVSSISQGLLTMWDSTPCSDYVTVWLCGGLTPCKRFCFDMPVHPLLLSLPAAGRLPAELAGSCRALQGRHASLLSLHTCSFPLHNVLDAGEKLSPIWVCPFHPEESCGSCMGTPTTRTDYIGFSFFFSIVS